MAMNYYDLVPRDNLVANSFVAEEWDLKSFDPDDFLRAKRIEKWPADVRFIASTPEMDGDLDDFVVNNAMVPLVTPRLKQLIEEVRTPPIQWLPVQARFSSGRLARCFILHFLEHVQALDLTKTVVERHSADFSVVELRNEICTIRMPVLRSDRVEQLDLFRCQEFPLCLFASERFRKLFRSQKMTGVSFDKVRLSGA